MRDERIVENAATIGREVFGPGLAELKERHLSIGDVRGLGCFWALDLVVDRAYERTGGALRRYLGGDERIRRGVQGRWTDPVHELRSRASRPAADDHPRRGPCWACHPGRGAKGRGHSLRGPLNPHHARGESPGALCYNGPVDLHIERLMDVSRTDDWRSVGVAALAHDQPDLIADPVEEVRAQVPEGSPGWRKEFHVGYTDGVPSRAPARSRSRRGTTPGSPS